MPSHYKNTLARQISKFQRLFLINSEIIEEKRSNKVKMSHNRQFISI